MNEKLNGSSLEIDAQNPEIDELAVQSLAKFVRKDQQSKNSKDATINLHNKEEVSNKTKQKFYPEVDSITYHELEDFDDFGYEPSFYYDPDEYDQYGIALYEHEDDERLEFRSENRKFEVFPITKEIFEKYPFLNDLPQNIAVMGGMARSIAREMVAGEDEPIRDIDLVNILTPDDQSLHSSDILDELSQKYMADDYSFGHGIESTTLSEYFETRDFTVNEVLVMNGALVMSNFAYNDLQENIIRPTYYQASNSQDITDSRTAIRALTLQAVLLESTKSCPTLEDIKISDYFMRSFDAAVGMNKVLSRGAEVAHHYTTLLAEYDIIPSAYADKPKLAAEYLGSNCYPYGFYYRLNADEKVNDPTKDDKSFYSPGEIQYHATDPVVRAALAEYDDDVGSERYTGQYTQAEINELNNRVFASLE